MAFWRCVCAALTVFVVGLFLLPKPTHYEWEAPLGGVNNGTVTIVDPVVDAASGTIGVRLEVPNPSLKLAAGAKCLVAFPLEEPGAGGR